MHKHIWWRAAGLVVLILASVATIRASLSSRERENAAAFAACRGYRVEGHDGSGRVRLCVTEVPRGHQ